MHDINYFKRNRAFGQCVYQMNKSFPASCPAHLGLKQRQTHGSYPVCLSNTVITNCRRNFWGPAFQDWHEEPYTVHGRPASSNGWHLRPEAKSSQDEQYEIWNYGAECLCVWFGKESSRSQDPKSVPIPIQWTKCISTNPVCKTEVTFHRNVRKINAKAWMYLAENEGFIYGTIN